MRVLVTGASGYLGSRIVPELLRRGHEVVASGTGKAPPDAPWVDQADWRQVDVFDLRVLAAALADVDAVVYLIHGLGDVDFSRMDLEAAENMRDAVDVAGVRRVVYCSGIVPDVSDEKLSEHLRSRLEVEEILAQSHASTLALRAAIVVGAGSTSFEVVRQISERLPLVQTIPSWMRDTVVQPIAVADAVRYVAEAVERTDVTGHLDVAGPAIAGGTGRCGHRRFARPPVERRPHLAAPALRDQSMRLERGTSAAQEPSGTVVTTLTRTRSDDHDHRRIPPRSRRRSHRRGRG